MKLQSVIKELGSRVGNCTRCHDVNVLITTYEGQDGMVYAECRGCVYDQYGVGKPLRPVNPLEYHELCVKCNRKSLGLKYAGGSSVWECVRCGHMEVRS